MSVNLEMPKLSDTMTEGTVLKWHKQVGDRIEIGDILADIETDKATMEMEAFDEGVLTEIRIPAGVSASIGSILGVLNGNSNIEPVPAPKHFEPVVVPTQVAAILAPMASGERLMASPLARKVAADLGVDLSSATGTGPGGRIIKTDVIAASSSIKPVSVPSAESIAAAGLTAAIKAKPVVISNPEAKAFSTQTPQASIDMDDMRIELNSMRKIIATRLLLSKSTIPHFYLHLEADAAPLMSLRRQINEQAEHTHGNKYSVNDFILKAVINATLTIPEVNASFAGDHIIRFKHIGLAIAIAVNDGLVTPVIKQAETQTLLAISRAVKDLAARAKIKKLKPDEFDGGTITVTNLGAWGIESFDAIINPPQAAILSIGAVLEKPVVKNGGVVPGLRINLGLSCDHRVIDGALGAQFLAEIKKLIEKPAMMLL
jgi:pyruvate dehydrogenase E2 component (dihydrolipoamide acetyltransferase)